ncbi:sulfatase-like hydrolase/transferase [Flammeovirga yaeyamensis]|uniref:Sulfatase-like hydrolase/transferase n=1 Tax=Flammeovirga yaeyamensis TaxID=367791 RepID=A0AAX1NBC9_9BACT|nr:arylsulfatase [Flammeovirga yaeyamensis]MBB3697210.1 arylsulfatase A-like enzyme [Flammeovirga yaeyamensis]NMF33871.1 arylsulfatase [Flammeovirga yaeyamensis]QWG04869.1 sulfatase-like hydrolase/transferase [Flammeovirga yaeyamensis]
MKKRNIILLSLFIVGLLYAKTEKDKTKNKLPNVLLILADDFGYGDISAHQSDSKIETPALDKLINSGLSFSNAHAASSVCTPSRYSLLTGRYSWRSKLKSGVLFGYDLPLIQNEYTLGKMFKEKGYATASIGKWHLGLPWQLKETSNYKQRTQKKIFFNVLAKEKDVDLSASFTDTTWHHKIGFDYFYGTSASLDMPPYVMVENGGLTAPLTHSINDSGPSELYNKGIWRGGPAAENFDHNDVLPDIVQKTSSFIKENKDKPFFVYMPITAPHSPWLPDEKFKGKSNAGKYGDFLYMVDDVVAQVMKSLKENGVDENTIVIFTSDNGAPLKNIQKYGGNGHHANAHFRGQKGDLYEGGHHIPLVMHWPKGIKAKQKSNDLIVLTDILSTLSDIIGGDVPAGQAEDSHSFAKVIHQEADFEPRKTAVYHSQVGLFAIQSGEWKLIENLGSGGFSKPRFVESEPKHPNKQLYNLSIDPQEFDNRVVDTPEVAEELQQLLDDIRKHQTIN